MCRVGYGAVFVVVVGGCAPAGGAGNGNDATASMQESGLHASEGTTTSSTTGDAADETSPTPASTGSTAATEPTTTTIDPVTTTATTIDPVTTTEPTTTGASDAATTDAQTEESGPAGPPPGAVLASDVAAPGGWLYMVLEQPIDDVTLHLNGVDLGSPDSRITNDTPVGVWRVPSSVAVGEAELRLAWADANANAEAFVHTLEIVSPRFSDIADATGLFNLHDATGSPPACAESHTGVGFGDFDGDGWTDAFVGNVGSPGRLLRGQGNVDDDPEPDFIDVTSDLGVDGIDAVAMATFVDIDGDGDQDLYVGRRGYNVLFDNRLIPDGAAMFVDVTAERGLAIDSQRTMGVAFGDYDADGDLDMYEVNHAWCFPEEGSEIRAEDHLFRNDGGTFVERTADLGLSAGVSVGFSAAWVDLERDGDQDLVVINDDVPGSIGRTNEVWRNDGPGDAGAWQFTDVSLASGVAIAGINGMGLAIADVDGDGFADLAFSNIGENKLLLNDGAGVFSDVSEPAGIERATTPWDRTSVTWATHLWDHDNDGDVDLYFTGGTIKATGPVPDAFFDNKGDGTFVELTWSSALADPAQGKASALVDIDRDGAWDVVTAAWEDELRVWKNLAAPAENHWLDVDLVGQGANRDAIGAIVELTADGVTQTCFHTQRPSLGAGGEIACHFGLGVVDSVEALSIQWPDGEVQPVEGVDVDQRIVLAQGG